MIVIDQQYETTMYGFRLLSGEDFDNMPR